MSSSIFLYSAEPALNVIALLFLLGDLLAVGFQLGLDAFHFLLHAAPSSS